MTTDGGRPFNTFSKGLKHQGHEGEKRKGVEKRRGEVWEEVGGERREVGEGRKSRKRNVASREQS